jgi:heme oxygenase
MSASSTEQEQEEQLEQMFKELEEDIRKNAPKLDGFELERVIPAKAKQPDLNALVQVYIPFSKESNYQPADAHKTAVEALAKPLGLDDKLALLASVRKLADHYKSGTVIADLRYAQEGMDELLAKNAEKVKELQEKHKDDKQELEKKVKELQADIEKQAEKLTKENLAKHQGPIETFLKNMNAAWTNAEYTPKVMPAEYPINSTAYPNLESDLAGQGSEISELVGKFIGAHSKHRETDLKNYAEGTRFYVLRYAKVKDKDGKEGFAPAAIEVWKRKD